MGLTANVTEFNFGGAAGVAVDATGTTESPEGMRPRLRGMAAMAYKPAAAGYWVRLNQSSAGGEAVLKITDGTTDIASVVLDLSTAQELSGEIPNVNLAGIEGQSPLYWELEVTTAADASTVADVACRLEVEHVPTVTGC